MSKFVFNVEEKDSGRSIKDILRNELGFSKRLRAKLKNNPELVRLNGIEAEGWIPLKTGDQVTVDFPKETSNFVPENIPLDIIYQDNDLLILNKQAGIVCHPTKGHPGHTISNGVQHYIDTNNKEFKIRFINRLDMDTSGVLAIAKNSHSQDAVVKQMKDNQVEKKYLAVVKGVIEKDSGKIDQPIGQPDPLLVNRGVVDNGDESTTHYKVIARYHKGYSLVELLLETGRTHQIRVHLAHIGHPIVGDHLYGENEPFLIERQALHALSLSFDHPVTGQPMVFEAPLPEDMECLIKNLREYTAL
ncbi:MAG: RluA family pseudouridine synthase [Anaerovoracaceae bacterium]|jgi:23S rRNA pseudouridine1911/1915/1917 synthase|nr:RluA family pseudouridine synthase [Anaerovoracaceae bacterium]